MLKSLLRTVYDAGTRKALENARRERDETARTMASIAALEARLAAA